MEKIVAGTTPVTLVPWELQGSTGAVLRPVVFYAFARQRPRLFIRRGDQMISRDIPRTRSMRLSGLGSLLEDGAFACKAIFQPSYGLCRIRAWVHKISTNFGFFTWHLGGRRPREPEWAGDLTIKWRGVQQGPTCLLHRYNR